MLGAFAKLRKWTVNFVMSFRLTARIEIGSHWTDFYEIWCLRVFRKSNSNRTRIKCTLHEDQCTFSTISHLFLFRMRNVSIKICRENQNTHIVFSNFFSKIVPFVRLQMNAIRLCNTYCFHTETTDARTGLNVNLYSYCVFCFLFRFSYSWILYQTSKLRHAVR